MNSDTGIIKPMEEVKKLPEIEQKDYVPFTLNEEITIKGIVFKIVRVKQLRKEIHLKWVRKAV